MRKKERITFKIPDGYKSLIVTELGIDYVNIYNKNISYMFVIDQNNDFTKYKQVLTNAVLVDSDKRQYLVVTSNDGTSETYHFYTTLLDNTIIVGGL